MSMVDVGIRVSSHLKQELAWAADKWLHIVSTVYNITYLNSYSTKVLKGTKE